MLWRAAEIAELLDGMAKVSALGIVHVRYPLSCHRPRTAQESVPGAKLLRSWMDSELKMHEHHQFSV